VAVALDEHGDFPKALATQLQARRDQLVQGLRAAGLASYTPEGTYFATTDVSSLGWASGRDFCRALPERAGVVAIPMEVFYDAPDAAGSGRHLVRWAFCKQEAVIDEAVHRLAGADLSA
jgi:N-succinyldiaminopimelate aminotransferase